MKMVLILLALAVSGCGCKFGPDLLTRTIRLHCGGSQGERTNIDPVTIGTARLTHQSLTQAERKC